jgi:hypothetical protein
MLCIASEDPAIRWHMIEDVRLYSSREQSSSEDIPPLLALGSSLAAWIYSVDTLRTYRRNGDLG